MHQLNSLNKLSIKFIKIIEKNYIYINIIGFFLAIYIILFPLITQILSPYFPKLFECVYLKITGNPCPLCGGTRYLENIGVTFNDISYLFNPFGVIYIFIIFELFFRLYNIITRKKEKSEFYIKVDIIIHIIALICFIIYEISYIIIQNI